MPFRAYDPTTAVLMGDAFENAWADLGRTGHLAGKSPDVAKSLLASIIIGLVDQGVVDPHALSTAAVAKFKL
jgi:hypothetical protein